MQPTLPTAWRFIDGCPCPADIAPYIYIVLRDAGQTATSIYRGSAPQWVVDRLHAHGKHTQAEIHRMYPNISNPEGFSEHDLHSDGYANPNYPRGARIFGWQVGVDSGTNDLASRQRIEHAARKRGWVVKHPYSRGVEGHHWCFAERPRPHDISTRLRVVKLTATLPRR